MQFAWIVPVTICLLMYFTAGKIYFFNVNSNYKLKEALCD